MSPYRTVLTVIVVCATAFALAAAARHGLVEPADMTARCDGGARDVWCTVRALTIQLFVNQRIGWVALVLALFATATAWRSVAAAALFVACGGLVLYNTELCAPAALLALLVFVRGPAEGRAESPAEGPAEGQTLATASASSSPPYDRA